MATPLAYWRVVADLAAGAGHVRVYVVAAEKGQAKEIARLAAAGAFAGGTNMDPGTVVVRSASEIRNDWYGKTIVAKSTGPRVTGVEFYLLAT